MGEERSQCADYTPNSKDVLLSFDSCYYAVDKMGLEIDERKGKLVVPPPPQRSRLRNKLAKGCAYKGNTNIKKVVWSEPKGKW